MTRDVFTVGALRRAMRPQDRIRFGIDLKDGAESIVADAREYGETSHIVSPPFRIIKARGKDCVFYEDYVVHLVYRVIAKFIARRFRIYPLSRSAIVQSVLEALSDTTPMWVIRRDISSFYETVPVDPTRARLLADTAIPRTVRTHLRSLLNTHSASGRGLPRGVGLAALLSEMAMNEFDQAIRSHKGVYRYFRFADDILIFSYNEPTELLSELDTQIANTGMRFNRSKSEIVAVCNISKLPPNDLSFEYLGYNFRFNDKCHTTKARTVEVSIAARKIARIKSRILCSLRDFEKGRDFRLLHDRIRYLSGNYTVSVTKSSSGRTGSAFAGIFYSYPQCGTYRSSRLGEHSCAELKSLDGFYHSLLKGNGSKFRSLLVSELDPGQILSLNRVSFLKGFQSRYLLSISSTRISRIKKAWQYAK